MFSVVKSRVRRDCPGTVDDLIASIRRALEYIGEMDLGPTFDHCVRASQGESDRLQLLLPSTTWTRPQYPALPGSSTAPRLAEEVEMSSGSAAGAPAGPGGQGGDLQPGTVAEASGSHEANEGSAGPPDPLKTTFVSYVFESKVSGAESRLNSEGQCQFQVIWSVAGSFRSRWSSRRNQRRPDPEAAWAACRA